MDKIKKSRQAYAIIKNKLTKHQKVLIHPQGYSMWPFLVEKRDSVIVEALPVNQIHRADIILYQRDNDLLVLHRVHHKNKKGFYVTGDNQIQLEGPIQAECIIGVVTWINHKKRQISRHHLLWLLFSHLWLLFRPTKPFFSKIYHKIHHSQIRKEDSHVKEKKG